MDLHCEVNHVAVQCFFFAFSFLGKQNLGKCVTLPVLVCPWSPMTLKNHVGMFCTIFLHFQKHCDFLKITILAANVVISRFVIQFANLFVQNENI